MHFVIIGGDGVQLLGGIYTPHPPLFRHRWVELLIWYTLVKSDVTGSIPGVSHIFRIVRIIIPACLIKQPNGTLSRMYVQTYISVKWLAVSVHSEAWNECSLECISLILAGLQDPSDSCDWPVTL